MSEKKVDETTGVETTGHSWDGIEELNNPLPRWWLWTLYATIIWGIGYVIAYPAWPMISSATSGVLGYSTRGEVAAQIAEHEAENAQLVAQLNEADLATLAPGDDLHRYAVSRGGAVFKAQCSQCHGSGAAGATGYSNLLDNDWLWGGDIENIALTIRHGIRNETDLDARYSEMPAYDEVFEDDEIDAVVEYVYSLSRSEADATLAAAGSELFLDNCAACHGDNAEGNRDLGAPNLGDAIWLYGGDRAALEYTVRNARYGVMPAWGQRLSDEDVRAVSVYVHSLGGGE
ncbi:cytochrome-c oxidase, cbb3-type subunit III [Yoonia sediminilitoris]|uniref:Cbb3-type cytochrome c oxidase subunit n=1 Tax=Yoonia sediminilitoris TaxID=1286148 RepID=A0A2T6KIB7_9RHOB|nr:cytochrome-c oxidase, cbb3-type subunit III [Yoonia sediminilitoris]PUB15401.1 cytochrome c oxidase cbb3-type subunit 3 [Yoonia sediminilitoris]RCW96011.1 cytochrome c oxidase cbb3-type subunit 3 [Yoonia sediminilitoris]